MHGQKLVPTKFDLSNFSGNKKHIQPLTEGSVFDPYEIRDLYFWQLWTLRLSAKAQYKLI